MPQGQSSQRWRRSAVPSSGHSEGDVCDRVHLRCSARRSPRRWAEALKVVSQQGGAVVGDNGHGGCERHKTQDGIMREEESGVRGQSCRLSWTI